MYFYQTNEPIQEYCKFSLGLGKEIVVKKLSDSHFYKSAETFTKKNVSKEDVIFVGDTALVLLYGGSCAEGLDSLRYNSFVTRCPRVHHL